MGFPLEVSNRVGGRFYDLYAESDHSQQRDHEIAEGVTFPVSANLNRTLEIVQYDDRIIIEHGGTGATFFDAETVELELVQEEHTEQIIIRDGNAMYRVSRYHELSKER